MGRKIALRVRVFFGCFMWVEFSVLYPLVSEMFISTLKLLFFFSFWNLMPLSTGIFLFCPLFSEILWNAVTFSSLFHVFFFFSSLCLLSLVLFPTFSSSVCDQFFVLCLIFLPSFWFSFSLYILAFFLLFLSRLSSSSFFIYFIYFLFFIFLLVLCCDLLSRGRLWPFAIRWLSDVCLSGRSIVGRLHPWPSVRRQLLGHRRGHSLGLCRPIAATIRLLFHQSPPLSTSVGQSPPRFGCCSATIPPPRFGCSQLPLGRCSATTSAAIRLSLQPLFGYHWAAVRWLQRSVWSQQAYEEGDPWYPCLVKIRGYLHKLQLFYHLSHPNQS